MESRIQKWGNSLAVRIPRSIALDLGVEDQSAVEMTFAKGELVIRPAQSRKAELARLLEQITDENRHGEQWNDTPRGREAW